MSDRSPSRAYCSECGRERTKFEQAWYYEPRRCVDKALNAGGDERRRALRVKPVCVVCRERPATHFYDDWGEVYCCLACGMRAVGEAEREFSAPRLRVLTPIEEGLVRVEEGDER